MRVRFLLLFWLAASLGVPWATTWTDDTTTPGQTTTSETIDIWSNGHVIGTPDG